jgi:hypothetical protein
MAKITKDDIRGPRGLGFTREMYGAIVKNDMEFDALVDAVISEQADILSGRIGSTAYNLAANLTNVKKSEKSLSAAEMVGRRINIILGDAVGGGQDANKTYDLRLQRDKYLDDAEIWIAKIAQGVTADPASDFSSGSLVTSHFE